MSCLAFDIHTGELVSGSLFDWENDLFYVTSDTWPLYDINNKYMGLTREGKFISLDEIVNEFW